MKEDFKFSAINENLMDFTLDRIKKVLKIYVPRYDELKIIHIAGTNGKGFTSSLISEIFYKTSNFQNVGLFTSPHVEKVNERIKINGKEILDLDFETETKNLEDFLIEKDLKLTYFEFLTVLAIKYFVKNNVDIAVFECGLGGRLDATNVFTKPLITVITNIDLEHQNILGSTIEKIFSEKMGINRENVPMVLGITQEVLISSLEKKKKFYIINRNFYLQKKINGFYDFYSNDEKIFENIKLKALGNFQYQNLALVLEVVYLLYKFYNLNFSSFDNVVKVINEFILPFRMEFLDFKNNILGINLIFDVGHNYPGIKSVLESIKNINSNKKIIIFGVLEDKDYKKIFDLIYDEFDFIYLTDPISERKLSYEVIYNYALEKCKTAKIRLMTNDTKLLLGDINNNFGKNDLVCILGSFYLVKKFIFLRKIQN